MKHGMMNIPIKKWKIHIMKHLFQKFLLDVLGILKTGHVHMIVSSCLYALYKTAPSNYHIQWSIQSTLCNSVSCQRIQSVTYVIITSATDNQPFNNLQNVTVTPHTGGEKPWPSWGCCLRPRTKSTPEPPLPPALYCPAQNQKGQVMLNPTWNTPRSTQTHLCSM